MHLGDFDGADSLFFDLCDDFRSGKFREVVRQFISPSQGSAGIWRVRQVLFLAKGAPVIVDALSPYFLLWR